MKDQVKKKTVRLNMDLPKHAHDYLESLHGTKKHNAEAIIIAAAQRHGFKPEGK